MREVSVPTSTSPATTPAGRFTVIEAVAEVAVCAPDGAWCCCGDGGEENGESGDGQRGKCRLGASVRG